MIDKEYFKTDDIINWWDPDNGRFSEYLSNSKKIKELHNKILKDFLENVDFKGKTVLDAGVGKGRFAANMMLNGAASVVGLDLNEKMLEITKARCSSVVTLKGDIENIPLPDRWVDVVSCMETLIHVPDTEKAVREFARVVKDGGLVVVNIQGGISYLGYLEFYGPWELLRGACRFLKLRIHGYENHTHLVKKKEFEEMLGRAGLVIEKTLSYGKLCEVAITYVCRKNEHISE